MVASESTFIEGSEGMADTARIGTMDTATATVSEKLRDAGQKVGERLEHAGQTLERAGSYLAEQDLAAMRRDIEGLVRRRPIEAILVGLGLGFLLARSLRW
jgi:ElaB/YqjD/DUF883 family membrane-anchored ribosome-binding protein